jgi:hypothetical protein
MINASSRVAYDGIKNAVVVLTGFADSQGGAETKVVKVDASEMLPGGRHKVGKLTWDVYGGAVRLLWDDANDDVPLATLSGQGEMCFDYFGGLTNAAPDPSGDILLSTQDFLPGSSYTISLDLRK